jgi:pimeloyl-ACP methyl ester carboxylesterase
VQHGSGGLRQRVYFLSGFDPRGSSFYYRLFVEQLQSYAARSGRSLTVGPRRKASDGLVSCWHVVDHDNGGNCALEVAFLHWDDIVRDNWPKQPLMIAWKGFRFALWYLLGGGLLRWASLCPSVALCGFYPLLFAAACGAALALLAWLVAALLGPPFGVVVAALVVLLLIPRCWQLADREGVVWLFRSILFTHGLGQVRDLQLRRRLDELADRIVAIEQVEPAQRVQLVGHSSGSFVMAMLAATLRRHSSYSQLAPRLGLLSLGQNLANLAVYRGASAFHDDLRTLAQEPRIPWRDITSRHDYLCFAGVDPYRSCGLPMAVPSYPQLELIELAQRQGLSNWWALITNQFPLHFEYLKTAAPELQGGFDYFETLLGEPP